MMITGELIQSACDFIVSSWNALIFNPYIVEHCKSKWIDIEKEGDVLQNEEGARVFVYPHEFKDIRCLRALLRFQRPFHLVLHNSDAAFDESYLKIFDLVPLLKRIYSVNCLVQNLSVFPIPIGFQNRQWWSTENDLEFLKAHALDEKKSMVYFYFSLGTNPVEREECKQVLESRGFTWYERRPFIEYVGELAASQFCICPVGNGVDTHRFWEALALRSVPICLSNPVVEYYAQFLPVIVLNNWEELSLELLESLSKESFEWSNLSLFLSEWDLSAKLSVECPTA